MPDVVHLERQGAVAIVRIDRPKVNALDETVVAALDRACACIEDNREIRAAILTGGGRVFSAGADLAEMARGSPEDVRRRVGALARVCDRIERLPVVVVAAIAGYALGGGCELAMACDMRLAHRAARLGQPEIAVGLIPGGGGTQRLARLVGPARAKWMIFSGESVPAARALEWGLVHEVVEGDVVERALELATRFASGPTLSLAAAKRAISLATAPDAAALERELDEFVALLSTRDTRHGIESFLEQGPGAANFEGR